MIKDFLEHQAAVGERCARLFGWDDHALRGALQEVFVGNWACCPRDEWASVSDEVLRSDWQDLLDVTSGKLHVNFVPSTSDAWSPPLAMIKARTQ